MQDTTRSKVGVVVEKMVRGRGPSKSILNPDSVKLPNCHPVEDIQERPQASDDVE
jgi:hypothetical protein